MLIGFLQTIRLESYIYILLRQGIMLNDEEIKRYHRQIILPEVGIGGQERLKGAKIVVLGLGGLGCPASLYLAAAGVGTLGLVDNDKVGSTNLQRQVLYTEEDLGKNKAEQAKRRLEKTNPHLNLKSYPLALSETNAEEIIKEYDLVIDCTDNFQTRYLANAVCLKQDKPYIYGSVSQFEGQVSVFSKKGPCYCCIFPALPEDGVIGACAENGVLGVLPGIIGLIQAAEAIKIILNQGTTLLGRLLIYDALKMQFREFRINKNPKCRVCSIRDINQGKKERSMEEEITPKELKHLLDSGRIILIDIREQDEYELCHIKGAKLVPMSELREKTNEIPKDKDVVLYCHSGRRSMHVLKHLQQLGWTRLKNLKGGIDQWAEEIEPQMPRY